ncbi:hypothetical protein SAMN02990966_04609 [Rhodospirillales bacterium URHD0017]|jgi:hypothetical protein|nr:hypothetical protein SAMN02990966_04609 [Rhodospirillales bacterium URHD0017]
MTRKTLAATATAIFAAGAFVAAAQAQHGGGVKCTGVNSCKGTSACKTANSACKGQNACKGQGWTQTSDVVSCTSRGGKVVE